MVAVTGVVTVVGAAIKAATGLIGVGKTLWFLPTFLAALAYYNYDLFDPEQRPINQRVLREEYDFIIVGGGSAGEWRVEARRNNARRYTLALVAGTSSCRNGRVPRT